MLNNGSLYPQYKKPFNILAKGLLVRKKLPLPDEFRNFFTSDQLASRIAQSIPSLIGYSHK
jgi:hypothetical protein